MFPASFTTFVVFSDHACFSYSFLVVKIKAGTTRAQGTTLDFGGWGGGGEMGMAEYAFSSVFVRKFLYSQPSPPPPRTPSTTPN